MMLIDLKTIGADLRRRCAILKKLRKYNFPQSLLERFIEGFVCGKLRFYTPLLGAETHHSDLLKPLELAYRELMRTELGAVRTTPIPLLQAGTRRPSLKNVIAADAANMIVSSIANKTILGREYLSWDGYGDGWSPFGLAQDTLRSATADYTLTAPKEMVQRSVKDGIFNCSFKIPDSRKEAMLLHMKGELLTHCEIEVWVDGSFSPHEEIGGAASILIDNGNYTDTRAKRLTQISSSYEAELAALHLGLTAIRDKGYSNVGICIYSDSQGLLKQLSQLPFNYKTAEPQLAECAEALSVIITSQINYVQVCWIPGHMEIGYNNEADELAKAAMCLRVSAPPCPRLSSYKLRLKKELRRRTESEIQTKVQPSHISTYPDRALFTGYYTFSNHLRRNIWIRSPYTRKSRNDRGILFRIRSGHTRAKDHFTRLGIIDSAAPCRLCGQEIEETIEHQLFECSALLSNLAQPLMRLVDGIGSPIDINTSCWNRPKDWKKFLLKVENAGAWI
jgi:ribonuclease HI